MNDRVDLLLIPFFLALYQIEFESCIYSEYIRDCTKAISHNFGTSQTPPPYLTPFSHFCLARPPLLALDDIYCNKIWVIFSSFFGFFHFLARAILSHHKFSNYFHWCPTVKENGLVWPPAAKKVKIWHFEFFYIYLRVFSQKTWKTIFDRGVKIWKYGPLKWRNNGRACR